MADRIRLHVQLRATGLDGMCICDRVLEWSVGETDSRKVDFSEELGAVTLRAWVDTDLALEEPSAVLRSFGGRVDLIGASYTIRDRLTLKLERAIGAGNAQPASLALAEQGQMTAMTSRIETRMNTEPWAGNVADSVFDYVRPAAPEYAYFPRGAEGRATAILRFAGLISNAGQAYLVDPWFDAAGAEALLLRVRGDVRLTVLTNLPSRDRDAQVRRLADFLRTAAAIGLPENLKVTSISLPDWEEQAFHDRFLLLQHGSHWTGYVLTNSFSGFATQFPLFVVEAPAGTTGHLLDELERVLDLDGAKYEQLWPSSSPVVRQAYGDRGRFPFWRPLLQRLVPRLGSSEDAWLQIAQARGFVHRSDDGLNWRMTPAAQAAAIDLLLDPPRRFRRARRTRGASPGRARVKARTRRPFAIGRSILILGDLVAHGLAVEAHSIAQRLGPVHASQIELALRESFRDDVDPTKLSPTATRERLGLRQALQATVSRAQGYPAGVSLWNGRLMQIGRGTGWDRCFAYAVLAYLDPSAAVRLCDELLDADFVLSLVDNLRGRITMWSEPLAQALLRSRSVLLRGFGAQSLVHSSFNGLSAESVPPTATAAVERLRRLGVLKEDLVCFLASWGTTARSAEVPGIARALVEALATTESAVIGDAADILFEHEPTARPFLLAGTRIRGIPVKFTGEERVS